MSLNPLSGLFQASICSLFILASMHTSNVNAQLDLPEKWPQRQGFSPLTSPAPQGTKQAHRQISQNKGNAYWQQIIAEVRSWDHVFIQQSLVSVAGAVGFFIDQKHSSIEPGHFMRATEFAHIHPVDDGSFHIIVPEKVRSDLIKAGWAEPHPRKNHIIMLYAPRDKAELGIVMNVLSISYQFSLKKT